MRTQSDKSIAVPGLIHTFYKHQARGKPIVQVSGCSPDQTDYRPILKERAARHRRENGVGALVRWRPSELLTRQQRSKLATTVTTACGHNSDSDWDQKTPTAPTAAPVYALSSGGSDYFAYEPDSASDSESSDPDHEAHMKTPKALTAVGVPWAHGCESESNSPDSRSDSDEGYFSDKSIICTR